MFNRYPKLALVLCGALSALPSFAEEILVKPIGDPFVRPGFVQNSINIRTGSAIDISPKFGGDAIGTQCVTAETTTYETKWGRYNLQLRNLGYDTVEMILTAQAILEYEVMGPAVSSENTKRMTQEDYDRNCRKNYIAGVSRGGQIAFRYLLNAKAGAAALPYGTIDQWDAVSADREITPVLEQITKDYEVVSSSVSLNDPRSAEKTLSKAFTTQPTIHSLVEYVEGLTQTPKSELIQLLNLAVNTRQNPEWKPSRWTRFRQAVGL